MEKADWGPRLVAAIAGEVRRYRQRRGLSTQQLAEECARLGYPIKRSVLSNLELGYRETITVRELLVLAAVLRVAPVLLVFPLGREAVSEFLPDMPVDTWAAAQWFGGHGEDPSPTVNADRERVYRLPVRLYADHDRGLRRLSDARANAAKLRKRARAENGDIADALEVAEQNVRQSEDILRDIRRHMRDQGIAPPALTEPIALAVDGNEDQR